MDRNDYYGGESTSLNLIQVLFLLTHILNPYIRYRPHFIQILVTQTVENLQLWKKFRGSDKPPAHLGSSRDYNVDMIPKVFIMLMFFPSVGTIFYSYLLSSLLFNMIFLYCKFIMANGALVRVLIHTDVTKYLYFKAVDGSFVYNKGKVYCF